MNIQSALSAVLTTACLGQIAVAEETPVEAFTGFGSWSGPCDAWGVQAICTATWRTGLSPVLVVQEYAIVRTEDQAPIFAGRGLYRIVDGEVDGVWEDSRGVIQDLSGSYQHGVLRVIWGEAQTEIGRSVYAWQDGALEARDSVLTDDGWRDFMTIRYPAP
ncbi:MAG: hypothetical protein NXH78_08060 [Hyphomonadaceae bacterium]|nr:hypothetical protein [Hyphomonadaceae bacterium]